LLAFWFTRIYAGLLDRDLQKLLDFPSFFHGVKIQPGIILIKCAMVEVQNDQRSDGDHGREQGAGTSAGSNY